MQQQFPSRPGPLARVLSAIVLLAVFAVSFAVGAALFLVILGLVAVLGLAFYLRFRWLRRKWQRQASPPRQGGDVLEGEYTVKGEKPPTRH